MFIRSVKLGIESYLPLSALSRDSSLRFLASDGYSYTLEPDTFNLSTSRVTLGLDPHTHGFYKLLIVFHAGHIISLRTNTGDALAGVCRVLGLPHAKVKWLKLRKCLRAASCDRLALTTSSVAY
jgi:hypothetical protein